MKTALTVLIACTLVACETAPKKAGGHCPACEAFPDLTGKVHSPLVVPSGAKAHVLVFTSTDCPIANAYAPTLKKLAAEFESKGVRFFLVQTDPDITAAIASKHKSEYGYQIPVLRDNKHILVKATGATITPEAAVYVPKDGMVYRGRIDNLFADLGVKRFKPTTHELRDVLAAVVAGKKVTPKTVTPVGCFIPDLP